MEIKIIFNESPNLKQIQSLKESLNEIFNTDFNSLIEESINTRVIFRDN